MKRTHALSLAAALLIGMGLFLFHLHSVIDESGLGSTSPPPSLDARVPVRETTLSIAVPILMYHHVADFPTDGDPNNAILYVSPKTFTEQMDFLSSSGFRTIRPDRFADPHAGQDGTKPVVLTFDDGYEDAYTTVLPILKHYGFRATFYIVVRDIGTPGYLTRNEILEMQDDGMAFGSHTLTHPDLTTLPVPQAEDEIYGSKIALERLLNESVTDFCYPGGLLNGNIEDIVADAGYTTATTTVDDTNLGVVDPLRLNRLNIRETTDFHSIPQFND